MSKKLLIGTVLAVAALLAASQTRAQTLTTAWTNTFDTSSGSQNSSTSWNYWYDMYQQGYGSNYGWGPIFLDTNKNSTLLPAPTSGPNSGSIMFVSPWPGVPENTGKGGQNQIYGTFNGGGQYNTGTTIDATKYDSLSFDLYVDPSSPTNQAGHVCVLSAGFFKEDYSVYTITNVPIATNNYGTWMRYVCPINKATAPTPPGKLAAGPAFNVNCYGGENVSLFTNTTPTTMWIDNVYLKLSVVPVPPPTMSSNIKEPSAGLNLYSSLPTSDQYQRTSIKLINQFGIGWVGQSNVTYSITITNFPNAAQYPGYQAHIFITTGPGNYNGLDYSETNVIFFDIHQNSNQTAYAAFRYKINEPQQNTNMFGAEYTVGPVGTPWAGTLAVLGAPSVFGTWSLTFNQDTNVTVTEPSGTSTNFNLRPEIPPQFTDPLNLVFGGQPNQPGNVGQDVVLAAASATNAGSAATIVNDNFLADTILDTSTWTPLAAYANTVQLFAVDPGQRLVKWSLPDAGFGLQVNTNSLSDPTAWATLTGNEATGPALTSYSLNGVKNTIVPSANLGPSPDFFRMFTRKFTKLQVLMPGETAAPGTGSGKTGTPDQQQVNVPFTVTVNAVNPNWYLALTGSDTVHLTSSDTLATLAADAALVGGTGTFSVTFGTNGTATVTASDITDATKAPNTGSSTTVNP